MKYKYKVSFITPCFNDGDEIERFVDSIIDQDFTDWEMIIVNDGSTDNSKIVIDSLVSKDKRISAIHLPKNQGACVARNEGAKKAHGEIYSFLPADAFLYPGVLRTWVEQLDEYPDYAFVYGGYRVTDKDHNSLANSDFLFNPFDPYLLETANYIDGSFPIRAKVFWEVSELMNKSGKQKSEGLWDPAIKSLQDWDFWLSVVKQAGKKGIYIQDIFFETTEPHKGGLSFDSSDHWLERMDTIKKKHGIPIRKLCVNSLGATFHAKRIAYMLNADFQEMPSRKPHHYDSIYTIGFYPEFAALQDKAYFNDVYDQSKGRTSAKKIVHFIGSDIWQLRKISLDGLKIWKSYMQNAIDEVVVEAGFTQLELKEILDITAHVVPIPPQKLYEMMSLPKKFTIACYMPAVNARFYNPELMERVAKEMKDVDFKFFGDPMKMGKHKDIKNIEYMGYVNDMEAFIKDCSAIMRFPMHDGLPISVLEFLLAGRYASTNVPIREAYFVPNSELKHIKQSIVEMRKKAEKGGNKKGSDYWRKELDHKKYAETIGKLTGYDPKKYWEDRAESWDNQADHVEVEHKEVKKFYDKVNPKTLIDLGCGNGRWIPIFKKWGFNLEGYMGIDISGKSIDIAKRKYQELKQSQFFMEKVENLNLDSQYDLVFCYTTLEHIKEEDIQGAVDKIKKLGKKLLLIEPTGFESRYYCISHDYEKLFNVIEKKVLKDKTIYLCDLE